MPTNLTYNMNICLHSLKGYFTKSQHCIITAGRVQKSSLNIIAHMNLLGMSLHTQPMEGQLIWILIHIGVKELCRYRLYC